MLKNTVAIAKAALFFCERPLFAAANLNRLQFIKNIHQLYTIGANILYRGCTNPAGYQRQIFDTAPTLLNGIAHRLMPIFARPYLQPNLFGVLSDNLPPFDGHMQHQTAVITG